MCYISVNEDGSGRRWIMNLNNLIESVKHKDYQIMMMRLFRQYLMQNTKKIFSYKIILAQIDQFVANFCQSYSDEEIKDLIFVVVMQGAEPFTEEFMRKLKKYKPHLFTDTKPAMLLLRCSSYEGSTESSGKVKIEFMKPDDPRSLLKPASKVVVLEDIIETGNTLEYLCKQLNELFSVEIIKFYALIDKSKGKNFNSSIPIIKGLKYDGKLFLYGYGPDFNCALRGLSEIWGISEDHYKQIFDLIEPMRPKSQSENQPVILS